MTSSSSVPGRRRTRSPKGAMLVALGAAVALTVTACGAGAGTTSGKVDEAGLAAATKVVDAATQPTQLQVTTPIGKPVPKGKKLAFISCGSPECAQEGQIVKQATDALGWSLSVINTQGTPETEKAAFDQVAREKYDAVLYAAIDRSVFASDLAKLKANGTFISACCITDTPGAASGIDYANNIPSQTADIGRLMAAWVVKESKGAANVAYVQLPAFTILKTSAEEFKKAMKDYCPSNCTTDELDIPLSALGVDVPTRIVSYLRAHPNVKYLAICTDGITIGLPAALQAAGLSDVKIIGQGATATNLQYIHAGQEGASIAFPYYEALWGMVDAVARHAAGVPQVKSAIPSLWLLTKDNAPTTDKLFPVIADSEQQFKKLWGVS